MVNCMKQIITFIRIQAHRNNSVQLNRPCSHLQLFRPQQARAAPGVCAHAFRNNVLGLRCFKEDGEKKGGKTGNISDGMGGHNVESEPEHSMARRAFLVTTLAPLASVLALIHEFS